MILKKSLLDSITFVGMDRELCLGFYNTAPLWVNEQFGIEQFEFPELLLTEFESETINERLRLGHQMEIVFEQLISFSEQWKILAKNLLIDEGKIRLGELDFILRNIETAQVYHIELAYKFYIVNPDISEPIHRLMGPNKRDMFFTKLDKLKEKQFPLLYNAALHDKLQELEINPIIVIQQACFKTQLFVPYGDSNISIRPLNNKCIQGSWLRFNDFNSETFRKFEYYIPFKKEWVITPTSNRKYTSHYAALLEVNLSMLKENAPMLWVKKPDGTIEKLFVVWW
ncbi:DUF1853 family protein [Flagellimonas sp. HMM57]|uniref:DUF1853 family protein n=1 Tax=unclassified Flagellimonas TaxID=2644544 RepID=UPI0013D1E420|nr:MULTISPECIES: DUF1853 family protein [unclassified Flagellimonas]UII75908.1 DUF1853 family protein [Flagellimonas sp. HMM57]